MTPKQQEQNMEIKYQLKPTSTDQKELERTIYVIARCLSMSGFSITRNIYEKLTENERKMFETQVYQE